MPWTNWTVNALLPTPPLPKTTNLYSRIIWRQSKYKYTAGILKRRRSSYSIVWGAKKRDNWSAMTLSCLWGKSDTQKNKMHLPSSNDGLLKTSSPQGKKPTHQTDRNFPPEKSKTKCIGLVVPPSLASAIEVYFQYLADVIDQLIRSGGSNRCASLSRAGEKQQRKESDVCRCSNEFRLQLVPRPRQKEENDRIWD